MLFLGEMYLIPFVMLIGLSLGSFIGVLVDRIPKGEYFKSRHSYCLSCGNKIRKRDLIPVLAFIKLRGKCHFCNSKIPISLPLLEITTAIYLTYIFLLIRNLNLDFLFQSTVWVILLSLALIDWRHLVLPNELILALLITILVYIIFKSDLEILIDRLKVSLLLLLSLILLRAVFNFLKSCDTFGMGDIKFYSVVSLYFPVEFVGVLVFLSASITLLIGLVGRKPKMPLGVGISAAFLIINLVLMKCGVAVPN